MAGLTQKLLTNSRIGNVLFYADKSFTRGAFTNATETPSLNKVNANNESGGGWSNWTGKNAWKTGLLGLTGFGSIFLGTIILKYGPPDIDEEGNEIIDKYSEMPIYQGYLYRGFKELFNFNQSIRDPISDKLLPDPLKYPYYQPPYTLVLEMNNILVYPDWKFRSGWRYKKRPALEAFLQQLHPYFEVVVFSSESLLTAGPVLAQLDPQVQYFHHKLYREATRYRNGKHIKDLSCLNRDLSHVVLVDWNENAASLQPENAFLMKPWKGDDADTDLIDLAAFLRMIAMSQVDDVRPVLEHYRSFPDPLAEFRVRNEQLLEQERQKEQRNLETNKKLKPKFSLSGIKKPTL